MARTRIICPTHDHVETLFASIASVQAQRDTDWELVVIGDGAPDRSREIVEGFGQRDPRISYVSHPKGERFGEVYRDPVIRNSDATYICHLGDDDLWHETHLESMIALLDQADWAVSGDLRITPAGAATWRFGNLAHPPFRAAAARTSGHILFGTLNGVAVRRSAYLALETGWEAAPVSSGSDVFMWLKYIRNRDMRLACSARATHVKFQAGGVRAAFSGADRLIEMQPTSLRINRPGYLESLHRGASVGGPLAKAFALTDLSQAQSLDDAFTLAGIRALDQDGMFGEALDGDMLPVALTHRQRDQARLAWALAAGPELAPGRFRAVVRGDRRDDGLLLHYLDMIAQANGQVALQSADALHTLCDAPFLALHARVRILIQTAAFEAAAATLSELERRWPAASARLPLREAIRRAQARHEGRSPVA
jgi:hypothetical protein